MADTYIDQDETQLYGPHAARYLRSHVVGLVPKCDDAVKYSADEIDHVTEAVGTQIAAARTAESGVRKHARDTKVGFHNASKFDFDKLVGDPTNLAANLVN